MLAVPFELLVLFLRRNDSNILEEAIELAGRDLSFLLQAKVKMSLLTTNINRLLLLNAYVRLAIDSLSSIVLWSQSFHFFPTSLENRQEFIEKLLNGILITLDSTTIIETFLKLRGQLQVIQGHLFVFLSLALNYWHLFKKKNSFSAAPKRTKK